MANINIYHKGIPCIPPVVNGITFALDSATGMWMGTGAEAVCNPMVAAGSSYYLIGDVLRFKAVLDSIVSHESSLVTAKAAVGTAADSAATSHAANAVTVAAEVAAQSLADSTAAASAADPGSTPKSTAASNAASALVTAKSNAVTALGNLATAKAAIVTASDAVLVLEDAIAISNKAEYYRGKPNPFI